VARVLRLVGLGQQAGQQAIAQADPQLYSQAGQQPGQQASQQAGRQAGPTGEPTGRPTAVPTGDATAVPTGEPTGGAKGGATGEPTATPADRVAFHRVGDTFEPASSQGELTPAERAADFLQFLQERDLAGGWFWRSDLEGIYGSFERDFGLSYMSWTRVVRGLSEVTRKRRKERGIRWLPNGECEWPTEMQYYIPCPAKKKKPRPQ
jgi:hypothetical protein